jgi:transmembrane sensor
MPNAISVEEQAADWLDRRDQQEWTAELQSELEEWFTQSPANRLAYLRLYAAWIEASRLAALRRPKLERLKGIGREFGPVASKFAAVATIAGAIGIVSLRAPSVSEMHTYITPIGGHETLKLADGSQIELNTDTVVRISTKSGTRQVWLDKGEAYFQIQHDTAHPFTVVANGHRIVDLGTKFLVQTEKDGLRVSLVEGRARVESQSLWNTPQSALLAPGDVVVATATTMSLEKKPVRTLNDELAWRHGMLSFDRTPLADVVSQFNRYNATKLVVEGRAAQMKIDGKFPATNVDDFLHLAREMLGLRVAKAGNVATLSEEGLLQGH